MKLALVLIGITIAVYVGNVIGIYAVCDGAPNLYKAKKYVAYIPAFTFLCILSTMFCREFRNNEKSREVARGFIRIPHKSIWMAHYFEEVIAEEKVRVPRKKPRQRDIFGGVVDLFQTRAYYTQIR